MPHGCAWAGFVRLAPKLPSVQKVPYGIHRDAFVKSIFARLSPEAKTTLHRTYLRSLQRRGLVAKRSDSDVKPQNKVPALKLVPVKVAAPKKTAAAKIRKVAKVTVAKAKAAPSNVAVVKTATKPAASGDALFSYALHVRQNLANFSAAKAEAAAVLASKQKKRVKK